MLVIYIRQRRISPYYMQRLRNTPTHMDMPDDNIYRSFLT